MLFALSLLATARADDAGLRDLLAQAKGSLLAGEYRDARDLLDRAEAIAPEEGGRVTTKDLGRLFFYRGVLYWRASPESAALDAWRQALTVDLAFQPEPDLLADASERDVFFALADEVRARGEIGLGVPEDLGEAAIYVDGREVAEGDAVVPGRHYVQVRCEDGDWAGAWHAYGAPPSDYFVLCDGGSYKSRASASGASSASASRRASSSAKAAPADAKPAGSGGFTGKDAAGVTLLGLGAAGGGVSLYLYTQAAATLDRWETKRDSDAARDDVDAYYDEVVVPSYMRTWAVGAASGVLAAGGVVLVLVGEEGPMVSPLPGGGVLTWTGRF